MTYGISTPLAAYGVFLPILAETFGWSRGAIATALSINLLLGGVAGFAIGALADRHGPRLMLVVTVVLAGAAFALVSTVGALWQLEPVRRRARRRRHVELLSAGGGDGDALVRRGARAGAGARPGRLQSRLHLGGPAGGVAHRRARLARRLRAARRRGRPRHPGGRAHGAVAAADRGARFGVPQRARPATRPSVAPGASRSGPRWPIRASGFSTPPGSCSAASRS